MFQFIQIFPFYSKLIQIFFYSASDNDELQLFPPTTRKSKENSNSSKNSSITTEAAAASIKNELRKKPKVAASSSKDTKGKQFDQNSFIIFHLNPNNLKLVSQELWHFGVVGFLFLDQGFQQQICATLYFELKTFCYKND